MLRVRALLQHTNVKPSLTARLVGVCTGTATKTAQPMIVQRNATTLATQSYSEPFMFFKNETRAPMSLTEQVSQWRPFSPPPAPVQTPSLPSNTADEGMQLTSILRKRRLKMNKHKHKKLRKRTRALRKRLGK